MWTQSPSPLAVRLRLRSLSSTLWPTQLQSLCQVVPLQPPSFRTVDMSWVQILLDLNDRLLPCLTQPRVGNIIHSVILTLHSVVNRSCYWRKVFLGEAGLIRGCLGDRDWKVRVYWFPTFFLRVILGCLTSRGGVVEGRVVGEETAHGGGPFLILAIYSCFSFFFLVKRSFPITVSIPLLILKKLVSPSFPSLLNILCLMLLSMENIPWQCQRWTSLTTFSPICL